jgi:hypothetical protein
MRTLSGPFTCIVQRPTTKFPRATTATGGPPPNLIRARSPSLRPASRRSQHDAVSGLPQASPGGPSGLCAVASGRDASHVAVQVNSSDARPCGKCARMPERPSAWKPRCGVCWSPLVDVVCAVGVALRGATCRCCTSRESLRPGARHCTPNPIACRYDCLCTGVRQTLPPSLPLSSSLVPSPRPPHAAATLGPRTKAEGGVFVRMEGQPLLELAEGHRAVPLLSPEKDRVPFAAALRIIQPGAAPAQVRATLGAGSACLGFHHVPHTAQFGLPRATVPPTARPGATLRCPGRQWRPLLAPRKPVLAAVCHPA